MKLNKFNMFRTDTGRVFTKDGNWNGQEMAKEMVFAARKSIVVL